MADPRFRLVDAEPPAERYGRATPVADITPERVQFFWPGRLAAGKLTVIDGDPGLGKSTMTLEVAARFTTGEALPGGDTMLPRGVMIMSAEDGEGDTIRPRLEAAGANLRKVFTFKIVDDDGNEHHPIIPDDLPSLEAQVQATNTGLIIIDPFVAYMNGDKNANRDQDVRAALAPLASMAERNDCAIIILRHLNKSLGSSPLYRGGGSIGIIGAARFGLIVAKDPEDPSGHRRVLAPQKVNIGPEPPALAYCLESVPGTDVARIKWLGETDISTAHLLDSVQSDAERSARAEARAWLADFLRDGPVAVKDIKREARQDGISDRTLERVKSDLGIIARREGFGKGGRFVWTYPVITTAKREAPATQERHGNVTGAATSMAEPEWPDDTP